MQDFESRINALHCTQPSRGTRRAGLSLPADTTSCQNTERAYLAPTLSFNSSAHTLAQPETEAGDISSVLYLPTRQSSFNADRRWPMLKAWEGTFLIRIRNSTICARQIEHSAAMEMERLYTCASGGEKDTEKRGGSC
jgi:hypothetical protein